MLIFQLGNGLPSFFLFSLFSLSCVPVQCSPWKTHWLYLLVTHNCFSLWDLAPSTHFGYLPIQVFYGIWDLSFLQFVIPPFYISTSLSTLQLVSLWLCIIGVSTFSTSLIELHAGGNWFLVKAWKPFHTLSNANLCHYFTIIWKELIYILHNCPKL